MLVLSRKRSERIVIDGNIVVTVVDIRGDKVRLGIEAPKDVSVHRSEVYEALQREQAQHAEPPPEASASRPDDRAADLTDSHTFKV